MRLAAASLLLVLVALPTPALAPTPKDKQPRLDDRTKQSVERALKYLQTQQNSDGSWGNTAISAFTLLAFMSNGNVPNQGTYGPTVSKGIKYILSCARDDGYLVGPRGGNMYCHGMATLALSQAYGMSPDEDVKKVLKKSVELIVKTQNNEGGWRYDPAPTGADISVTIMQVMALRGAKDSGLQVTDEVMKKALAYINRCRDSGSGGYRYQPFSSGAGYARTAAGVCVLQLCGQYEAKEIAAAVEYLRKNADDRSHYWYGHYYAAHALNQVGGKIWDDYYKRMKDTLLSKQRPTGEWYDRLEQTYGPVYQTSIAVLILSVPTHFLPIYQR